jgi:hypothetical protein
MAEWVEQTPGTLSGTRPWDCLWAAALLRQKAPLSRIDKQAIAVWGTALITFARGAKIGPREHSPLIANKHRIQLAPINGSIGRVTEGNRVSFGHGKDFALYWRIVLGPIAHLGQLLPKEIHRLAIFQAFVVIHERSQREKRTN